MTDDTASLILEQMRAFRNEIADLRNEQRLSFLSLDAQIALVRTDLSVMRAYQADEIVGEVPA